RFAWNGLDNIPRHFLGIKKPLENLPFQLLQNFRAASLGGVAMRAAVRVWIRDVLYATQQRSKSLALGGFRSRQRKRPHAAPEKAPIKRYEFVALGCITCQFDRAFDGLGPRVSKKH